MRRDELFLVEVIEAAERIVELTAGADVPDLAGDRSRREALLWSFTVLGEACSQLDDELKRQEAQVPWRAATAMRNRIVHAYWRADLSILLATAQDDIPLLLEGVRDVLERVRGTR